MRLRVTRSVVVLFTLLPLVVVGGEARAEEAGASGEGDGSAQAPEEATRPVQPPDPMPVPTPVPPPGDAADAQLSFEEEREADQTRLGAASGPAAQSTGGEAEVAGGLVAEPARPTEEPAGDAGGPVEAAEDGRESTGRYCVDAPEARWVYHQLFVAKYNPLGAEDNGRLGICSPLITRPGMLFDYTHLEFGLLHSLSPAYFHLGGYFQIAPLSLISFRVEASGLVYWNLPLDRSAYFSVPGYDTYINSDYYPTEQGASATGWTVAFSANLQARVSIGRLGLIVLDSIGYELWRVGEEPYYINLRHEIVMAQFDTVLANEAMLMLEIPVHPTFSFRIGAYDSLRYAPGGLEGFNLNNSVGLLAMLAWPRNGDHVRGLTPFLRVGWYTNRPTDSSRAIPTIFLGLLFNVDIARARYGATD
jgi:hypothetical protein